MDYELLYKVLTSMAVACWFVFIALCFLVWCLVLIYFEFDKAKKAEKECRKIQKDFENYKLQQDIKNILGDKKNE